MIPKLENVIFFQAEKMMRQTKEITKKVFAKHGFDVTVDQWVILKKIDELSSCSQIQLADNTFKDPASIKRILDILQEKGLITRKIREENKKEHKVSLTKKADSLITAMIPVVQELRKKATEGFSEGERYALLHLLKKMNKNL
jgi:DNA-binding MarR family transcriptional regulator